MSIEFSLAVPTLVTKDLEATQVFYRDQLGFMVNYAEESGLFCSFRRGEAFAHFAVSDLEPRPNRGGWQEWVTPADVSFFVDNVRALYEEYVGRGVAIHSEPTERPYGIVDMDVLDVHDYVLRFNEALEH
tara:strand:+ start:94 stop:483 length:390 start_codon:yes stop_codon:yes gene_type:complete